MDGPIRLDDPPAEVEVLRRAGSRRLTLRVDPVSGAARVTAPPRATLAEIRMFLMRQSDWLRAAQARVPDTIAVTDGAVLPVEGVPHVIHRVPDGRRAARLTGGILTVGGKGPAGPMVAAWLKLRARDALLPAVERHAAALGRRFTAVALRDTRSRWGSCSSSGVLSFSWRLAMAPPEVLDYVAAHEVAHLAEMNHAPRFWAVVARLMPEYERRRRWLKTEGRGLHRYLF